MPVSPNGVPPDPQPFEPQLIFYLLGHFRIATELFRVAGIRESRNSDFGMLRGGDSGGGGDSEETDASRTRRKRNRTPREKLEKYKKMVKKLEQAKLKLEDRNSRAVVARKENSVKAIRLRQELQEHIEEELNRSRVVNETLKDAQAQIDKYLMETPQKLNTIRNLQTFQTDLQVTLSRLTQQKFKLVKAKAQQEAQKENVELRARIILLERKIATLEESGSRVVEHKRDPNDVFAKVEMEEE
ncbi:hypothetical protein AAMO2058_000991200 [Amorphochlora amoebiformis]